MIYVKGTFWTYKKVGEKTIKVIPLTEGQGLTPFQFTPKTSFNYRKLKKYIRRHIANLERGVVHGQK